MSSLNTSVLQQDTLSLLNDLCAHFLPAVCIKEGNTVVRGGQVSRKLSYKDHVVELAYDGGSPCAANPDLKHNTIINFICRYLQAFPLFYLLFIFSFYFLLQLPVCTKSSAQYQKYTRRA